MPSYTRKEITASETSQDPLLNRFQEGYTYGSEVVVDVVAPAGYQPSDGWSFYSLVHLAGNGTVLTQQILGNSWSGIIQDVSSSWSLGIYTKLTLKKGSLTKVLYANWVIGSGPSMAFYAVGNRTMLQPLEFALSAVSYIGQTITFGVISGPATVSGALVTITGPGVVVVRATASGNGFVDYYLERSFTVSKVNQQIAFGALSAKFVTDPPFTVSTTCSSGLPVTYSIVSGPGTLAGDTITITGFGTVVVRAFQAGNDIYNAATADKSILVSKLPQVISLAAIPNKLIGDAPFGVVASVDSGLSLTLSILSGPATISGTTVTLGSSAGTVVIRASQAGNATYASAFLDTAFYLGRLYKSTQTAYCPYGQSGRPSVGYAESTLSQTDADFLAMANAQLGLVCTTDPLTNATGLKWRQARYLGSLGYRLKRAGWADRYIEFDGHLWWQQLYSSSTKVLGARTVVSVPDFTINEFKAADWTSAGVSPVDLAKALLI